MFWEALTEDGVLHKQILGEKFGDLDTTKIVELMLRDQPSAHSIPMDLNENILKMPNFNQMMIEIAQEVPDLHLHYDVQQQAYRFDERSLKFLKSAIIPFPDFYSSFGISHGKFLIDGFDPQFKFFIKVDDEYKDIYDFEQSSHEVFYFYNAHSEFKVGMTVQKGVSKTDSVQISQKDKFIIDGDEHEIEARMRFIFSSRLMEFYVDYTPPAKFIQYRIDVQSKTNQYSVELETNGGFRTQKFYLDTLDY